METRVAFNSKCSSLSLLSVGTTTLGPHYIVLLLLVIVPSLLVHVHQVPAVSEGSRLRQVR
jgi:hypothetical protein